MLFLFCYRDKQVHSSKEHYEREKAYYKDKQGYDHMNYKESYTSEVQYSAKERDYHGRHSDSSRKYDEKKKDREARYSDVRSEKHRRDRYEEDGRRSATGDKTLQDLRERLLIKRHIKEDDYRPERSDSHRERRHKEKEGGSSAFMGEAGSYVKEMIEMTTDDRRHYKKEDKLFRDDDKLTDKERAEQELRREKLLETGKYIFI